MQRPESKDAFDAALAAALPDRDLLEVLDAGCGARLRIGIGKKTRMTGIDISEESMKRNEHLDECILGDLEVYKFPRKYDIVFCVDVLEHLRNPEKAVKNMCSALADGGVIIIKMPNVLSLKGLVTKFSPHFFHVFILKRLFGYKNAGKPGHAPFPTFLKFSASPSKLRQIMENNGIEILFLELFEGDQPIQLQRKSPFMYFIYSVLCNVLTLSTLGRNDARKSELSLIGRKAIPIPVSRLESSDDQRKSAEGSVPQT